MLIGSHPPSTRLSAPSSPEVDQHVVHRARSAARAGKRGIPPLCRRSRGSTSWGLVDSEACSDLPQVFNSALSRMELNDPRGGTVAVFLTPVKHENVRQSVSAA